MLRGGGAVEPDLQGAPGAKINVAGCRPLKVTEGRAPRRLEHKADIT